MKTQIIKLLPWFLALFFAVLFVTNDPSKQKAPTRQEPMATTASQTTTTLEKQGERELQDFLVTRIIDGDTIEVDGKTRVRLIGIDSPEDGQCLYQEAKDYLFNHSNNRRVTLEKDVQEFDKYGRTLAYVWFDKTLINQTILAEGFAKLLTIPPDVKYVDQFIEAQSKARESQKGLWSQDICQTPTTTSECVIKGNISSSGEKIYHMPGQRYYEKTKLEENKGERWFCTEEEAAGAGWRKSKV